MKYFYFSFIAALVLSCSKEIKNSKRINALWKVNQMEVFDYDGTKTFVNTTGNIQFSIAGNKSKSGTYDFQLNYDYNGGMQFMTSGTYEISETNKIILKDFGGNQDVRGTIAYITSEDCILELPNVNYLGYRFVLKKL